MMDPVDPTTYVRQLQTRLQTRWLGRQIEFRQSVGSTNALALERISASATPAALHGALVVADEQLAGRGQRGRSWHSPPGMSIYASAILFAPSAVPPPLLVAAVALGIAEGLEQATGVSIGIKWPNDLWIGERKVAGILMERRGAAADAGIVVGFGINVHHDTVDFPEDLRGLATSLAAHASGLRRADLLVAVLLRLEQRLDAVFASSGQSELEAAYRARSVLLGRRVRLFDADAPIEGVVFDLSATSGLLLQMDSGPPRHVRAEYAREVRIA